MSVWRNGRAGSADEFPLTDDRGFLLGDGLFETVHVVGGAAPHLDRHLARLAASAAALRVPLPPELDAMVAAALPELVERERRPRRGVLRITVTRGRGRGIAPPGGAPELVLLFEPLPDRAPGAPAAPATARLVTAPRIDPRDPLAGHKVLSSMARVQARIAANDAGADVALLATLDGDVAEADAANLFVVVGGTVVTPPLDRGVLPGITRARCLEALTAGGRPAVERRVASADLERAEEAFLTSSLDGVRPLREVDGRALSAPGAVARWLARCVA